MRAIDILYERDVYLLIHNLNERTIAHRLGLYLQTEFKEMDVDCEYNKNIDEERDSKNIRIDKVTAMKNEIISKKKEYADDSELTVLTVYPDIVIHKRGGNQSNLLIIEIKKSTSQVDRSFDYLKLECYTTIAHNNMLNYTHGLFIEFPTKTLNPHKPQLVWFANGKLIQ